MPVLAPFSRSLGGGPVCHKLGIALLTYYQHRSCVSICQGIAYVAIIIDINVFTGVIMVLSGVVDGGGVRSG